MSRHVCTLAAAASLGIAAHATAVDVQFRQLDWLDENGLVMIPFSAVGEVEFLFDPANPEDQQFLYDHGGAWVNIVAIPLGGDFDWIVQNLYLAYPDPGFMGDSSPSVQFRWPIPDGMPIDLVEYGILITPEPIQDPAFPIDQIAPVQFSAYHAGGFEGGGSGMSVLPFIIGPWIGPYIPPVIPVRGSWTWLPGDLIDTVDEDINGCAPASAARSIEYMGWTFGFPTDSADDIYDDLRGDMGTDATGTTVGNFLTGKQAYTDREGLPIDTKQVFGMAGIAEVMDAIDNGCDVEIMIAWEGGGGHAAMITSVIQLSDGSYIITYVDDPEQGDGEAENEEHTIHVRPDGTFNGGSIIGFQIECKKEVPGDVDGDGDVDLADLGALLAAYGSEEGDPDYNPDADFDGDGDVDLSDLGELLGNFGT